MQYPDKAEGGSRDFPGRCTVLEEEDAEVVTQHDLDKRAQLLKLRRLESSGTNGTSASDDSTAQVNSSSAGNI